MEQTIRECMEEDVMADFLKRNRAEVVMNMTKKNKENSTGKKAEKKVGKKTARIP